MLFAIRYTLIIGAAFQHAISLTVNGLIRGMTCAYARWHDESTVSHYGLPTHVLLMGIIP